jgi:hypothetical protein
MDKILQAAHDRALRGDEQAGMFVLIYLQNALRGTGEIALSESARNILADMLLDIITGKDAREITFSKTPSGNPHWRRQARNQRLVGEMNWRIMNGMKPWPAAGEVAKLVDLTQKTVNNIWLKCKNDSDLDIVFKPKLPE